MVKFQKLQIRLNLLFDHSRLSPMVNANLFSIIYPFTWHRRQFIAVSPIKKRILKCMYICTYLCTYVHTMYVWFELLCLAHTNTTKIKATATFYDLCVLRNFESTEVYLSAKWVIIFAPTVYWCYLCLQHQYQPIQVCLPCGEVYSFWRIFFTIINYRTPCFLYGNRYGSTPTPLPSVKVGTKYTVWFGSTPTPPLPPANRKIFKKEKCRKYLQHHAYSVKRCLFNQLE